jgi:hypothetical protein
MMSENDSQSGAMGTGDQPDNQTRTHEGDSLSGYVAPVEGQSDEWIADDAIEALAMEKDLRPAESNEELAERIFDENLPVAAQAICYLARHSGNAQTRMRAAVYVVERKMGRVGDPNVVKKANDPLLEFVKGVSSDRPELEPVTAVRMAFEEADRVMGDSENED